MQFDDFEAEDLLNGDGTRKTSTEEHNRIAKLTGDGAKKVQVSGMFKEWFLDYASYVILERAVPHLDDGLKPVQRRILHSMKRLDDGRYNKVANIIGYTMQYHPHGDASIGDALVQLGQKDLLIDMQGNWGNILTGDGAAAPRYIEARLSKFALDVVFNPKTTEWMLTYDGRNQEPVTLPLKFPLLLAQGVEGIAVGLASKILPHNFNEIIDAAILHLKGKDFELYPDFPTGGYIDCSRYNDGLRGGAVKIRAKIEKLDRKTLVIKDIPFSKTTTTLIDSILKANDKGKIKIKKIDDNTAQDVEIHIHLSPDISPDKTIDALYAFTDCEISLSPNSCIIFDNKPRFMGVKEILRTSVERTKHLLTRELEIRLSELEENWHMSSLEKIFIENRIYITIEECETWESVIETIDRGLEPFKNLLRREITRDDIIKLTEIKIKRISKYDAFKANEQIKGLEEEMEEVKNHLANIVAYAINYFQQIKKKYGKGRERKTEIRSFDTIEATKVVVANEKLYVNRAEGFFGTSLKKDEFVGECSDIDEVIVILKNGKYIITKVSEKAFFGKNIEHISVFKRNDSRTIYNVLYRDGRNGAIMMKRCAITGVTRDKEYNLTKGTEGSEVIFLSYNPNGEAEVLKVFLKPRPRLRSLIMELDFSQIAIKGRQSQGNIFTRYAIHKVQVKEKIGSTLGGIKVWFDWDVFRLNNDGRGVLIGEFQSNDRLLVVNKDGEYYLSGIDPSTHFSDNILMLEKYKEDKVFSATYFDGEQGFFYVKRFTFEPTDRVQSFISNGNKSYLVELNDDTYPSLMVTFGGKNSAKDSEQIDVEEFIGVKSHKAKGKRISSLQVKTAKFVEPLQKEKEEETEEQNTSDIISTNEGKDGGDSASQMTLEL
ncbi:DNA gyrase/topoisomerase IV subunit A [Perlabentimonas gracilis]|uniref:DNA gyrase/topoisomerase IV subunit A n=1 Tax=Perlabentimonas gracilis TaxID=2715279 RepID=UPI0014075900|nr:DNA gyrase/topoisomerase IV subunit A [Perlabentimonas gracilis]NHB68437.1 DNA gyrase/topoisomerase IV subunit A [Perlabentimonas gracilis]